MDVIFAKYWPYLTDLLVTFTIRPQICEDKKVLPPSKTGLPYDSKIPEDPGKYFSAAGGSRKLKIWTLFSDRDPNPRPNVGNCFEKEL